MVSKFSSPSNGVITLQYRQLFRDSKFTVLFLAGTVGKSRATMATIPFTNTIPATFPLFVPPFFLPLYARSIGQSSQVGAALLAAFNFSSALGRVLCGLLSDKFGSVNSLLLSLLLSAVSMLVLWPISTSLAPLIVFLIINGMGNGGFFAIMPTVVGNVFGSARVSVAMGMMVTGWTGGYLLGAPIAGYLLEAYGGEKGGFESYRPAIFYAGSMALGAAGMVAYVRFSMSRKITARY
jgi:MFS family permease